MPLEADFEFLPLGAIIQTFLVPTKDKSLNIVQSFPTAELYQKHNQPFFGETIGRVANRISNAKINSLNEKSYDLAQNNGGNALHGGVKGWGKRIWQGPKLVGVREIAGVEGLEGGESVEFRLRDEDGEEGYPGTLDVSVVYTTGKERVGGKEIRVLGMEYEVRLVDDGKGVEETVVNVTNHSYFNLGGKSTIEGTQVTLCTNDYLPVDDGGIPISGPKAYESITPNKEFTLGPQEPNVDDCFIVDAKSEAIPLDTRSLPLTTLVKAFHPDTGIHLEVLSTEPAFQFYTGKYIDVPAVEGLEARGARSGFCVEPSRYVNAINENQWRGQVLLKKGEVYGSRIVYKGWSE
ncbi:putative Bifunctional protein gal10 [Sclerotinia borealis F-4128]|uniref:Putative Bifunctional protein gal10 n=1 Tax=Sclerotinia borealis (strain F-4128) TaxID=1432307 RepID=W9CNS5_SCLBF|nr:putative Bifunctional protein gal10 [Sclerotinia borealis F-4128]